MWPATTRGQTSSGWRWRASNSRGWCGKPLPSGRPPGRAGIGVSNWQPAAMVLRFLGLGDMPDQGNFFDRLSHGHRSWNQDQARTVAACDEPSEVPRHRADIVGCHNPAQRPGDSENLRLRHAFRNHALWQFEIHFRFAAKNPATISWSRLAWRRKRTASYLGCTLPRTLLPALPLFSIY